MAIKEIKGYITVYNPTTGENEQQEVTTTVETEETVSQLDVIEAQVTYTAMMTDTLLEV
mgnify:CR=1 FL=1